jgi:hypothetical protein
LDAVQSTCPKGCQSMVQMLSPCARSTDPTSFSWLNGKDKKTVFFTHKKRSGGGHDKLGKEKGEVPRRTASGKQILVYRMPRRRCIQNSWALLCTLVYLNENVLMTSALWANLRSSFMARRSNNLTRWSRDAESSQLPLAFHLRLLTVFLWVCLCWD